MKAVGEKLRVEGRPAGETTGTGGCRYTSHFRGDGWWKYEVAMVMAKKVVRSVVDFMIGMFGKYLEIKRGCESGDGDKIFLGTNTFLLYVSHSDG